MSTGPLPTFGTSTVLSKMPTSGIEFDTLDERQRRELNLLPAMLYHGVSTEEGVLMRMNAVPRSAAEGLGRIFSESAAGRTNATPKQAREFIRELTTRDWESAGSGKLSGEDYRAIWRRLAGEAGL